MHLKNHIVTHEYPKTCNHSKMKFPVDISHNKSKLLHEIASPSSIQLPITIFTCTKHRYWCRELHLHFHQPKQNKKQRPQRLRDLGIKFGAHPRSEVYSSRPRTTSQGTGVVIIKAVRCGDTGTTPWCQSSNQSINESWILYTLDICTLPTRSHAPNSMAAGCVRVALTTTKLAGPWTPPGSLLPHQPHHAWDGLERFNGCRWGRPIPCTHTLAPDPSCMWRSEHRNLVETSADPWSLQNVLWGNRGCGCPCCSCCSSV